MRSTEEIAARAFAARDKAQQEAPGRRRRTIGLLAAAICLTAGLLLGVVVPRLNPDRAKTEDGGLAGGVEGSAALSAAQILSRGIRTEGEVLDDAEGAAYLAQYRAALLDTLRVSGIRMDQPRFAEKGIGHLSISESGAVLKTNWRDFLVYDGDEIIAIYTLYKENGLIHATPAWGGPWFAEYSRFLAEHAGQELVYLYLDAAQEIILLPDGQAVNPLGYPAGAQFSGSRYDYYTRCKTPLNTYVP